MPLIAAALAPSLTVLLSIMAAPRTSGSGKRFLVSCFLIGACSIVPAMLLQQLAKKTIGDLSGVSSIWFYIFFVYCVIAVSEEGSKLLAIRLIMYGRCLPIKAMGVVIGAMMIGLGFASAEHLLYVYRNDTGTALLRLCISFPLHAACALLIGYYAQPVKFAKDRRVFLGLRGFLLAVFFHGSFDLFIFLRDSERFNAIAAGGTWLCLAAMVWMMTILMAGVVIRVQIRNGHNTTIVA